MFTFVFADIAQNSFLTAATLPVSFNYNTKIGSLMSIIEIGQSLQSF